MRHTANMTGSAIASNPLTAYGVGTAYSLTDTAAALVFGTTSPNLTINLAGTYLLLAHLTLNYNGATFAAVRNATTKLRRTNNTAADLTSSSVALKTDIITTLSYTMARFMLPPIIYTTANADDIISIFSSLDTVPTVGSLDVVDASIMAMRMQ